MNNPLIYTDPSGEWLHIVVGAVIGGVVNLATNWDNVDGFWQGVAAFGIGTGAGALTVVNPALGAIVGGATLSATNNIIGQIGNGVSLVDVQWGQVGAQAVIGAVVGGVTYGVGSAINQTSITNKLLDASGITNSVTRNLVGSPVNGIMVGTTAGFVNGIATGMLTGNWNLWEHTWKGAAYGAAGGIMFGGLTELGYQAQLKWGRNRGLNSDVTVAAANGGNDAINQMKRIDGETNGAGSTSTGTTANGTSIGEVYVVHKTSTGITTVYWKVNVNYLQPVAPYQYNSPTMPNIVRWLILSR